jgi:hypothetical protein
MVRPTLDLTGKDATFISNCYRWHSGISALEIYRNPPPQLALDKVKERIDYLQQVYEGGATGNHAQIAERIRVRKDVTEMFKKIIRYLEIVATEEDIPALIQAGFTVRKTGLRRKGTVPQPA